MQRAADASSGAEQISELLPHADAGLNAKELDTELPLTPTVDPGRKSDCE